ncbi:alpha/beta hydrolase family protein [Nonomuraea basaltis]|uniref:alpha/beta hydrolase family protein n=1 Tax=Nonomuraea basaltis TaxID=2495887 RepID=UPI00110C69EC|nr:alpha/beta hydrolase [Nonomuraea basaltis]TMR88692.1 alpha/beta hydrolase [Nonomuraea basaltis]
MHLARTTALALAGLLTLTAPTPAAAAAPAAAPRLPAPTGSHAVGVTSLHLKDASRSDPWVPAAKSRELMVSLWYPAAGTRGRHQAPYVTPKESELLIKDAELPIAPDTLSKVRTNAFTDAVPAGRKRGLPLVVLSPGLGSPRSSLTSLAEDLASRGNVVVGIDHTYESVATAFPDGRVTTCVACGNKDPDFGEQVVRSRAADVSFVLDQLTGAKPKWRGAALIDRSRIGMAGQSVGGASSIAAMVRDKRIRAGVNLDGTTFAPIPERGLSRPFLFLGSPTMHSPGGKDGSWGRDWKRLTGWKRWLVVTGAEHASFTDVPLLAEQIGLDLGFAMTGARSVEITRAYVAAFFARHLTGKPQPLLDEPSARYPEVTFGG